MFWGVPHSLSVLTIHTVISTVKDIAKGGIIQESVIETENVFISY